MIFSTFKKGEEKAAIAFLESLWNSINRKSIWKLWPLYKYPFILFQSGLVDNSPAEKLLRSNLQGRTPERRIFIGASDIENDKYVRFTNEDMQSFDDMVNIVKSSGSFPIVFPYTKYKGRTFVDGGVMREFDVVAGI